MGERTHVVASFIGKDGTLTSDRNSTLTLGAKEGAFKAYDLVLGGLSHCLFATLESIIDKMQISYDKVDLDITGIKNDEKVALLETVEVKVTAKGAEDEAKFEKAFEIATRYCSTYQTLSKVATMSWSVSFT